LYVVTPESRRYPLTETVKVVSLPDLLADPDLFPTGTP
jgi:hypothetical protein